MPKAIRIKNPQALFLDRDGVIWRDTGYLHRWADVQFEPGVFDFCRVAHAAGAKLIVITNQSGVGRGKYTEAEVVALHRQMAARFEAEGCPLTAVRYAPEHPKLSSKSLFRKPRSLLFAQSLARYALDPTRCIAIGDKQRDLSPAKALGMTTVAYRQQKTLDADLAVDSYAELIDRLQLAS